eukprot:GILK01005148.1.p1 GENE.GILK01005148.1~~GILK01005148.1.p1  ORF type:complete len:340 (-),score=60.17 GILK01005148.1:210-1229(-)
MHRSGISVGRALRDSFERAAVDRKGLIKLKIQDEEVVEAASRLMTENIESDFNQMADLVESNEPCYFAFRLDRRSNTPEWALVSFVPDGSEVRSKMLYASSRSAVKEQLGASYFVHDLFCSTQDELDYRLFLQSREQEMATKPLTEREMLLKQEARLEKDVSVRSVAIGGVTVDITSSVSAEMDRFAAGEVNWIELCVDVTSGSEDLRVVRSTTVDSAVIQEHVNASEARYYIVRLSHRRPGDNVLLTADVFVFFCPDAATVKTKMIYSTFKAAVLKAAAASHITFAKTLEARSVGEVSEPAIVDELYPNVGVKSAISQSFAKPSRPGKGKAKIEKAEF